MTRSQGDPCANPARTRCNQRCIRSLSMVMRRQRAPVLKTYSRKRLPSRYALGCLGRLATKISEQLKGLKPPHLHRTRRLAALRPPTLHSDDNLAFWRTYGRMMRHTDMQQRSSHAVHPLHGENT